MPSWSWSTLLVCLCLLLATTIDADDASVRPGYVLTVPGLVQSGTTEMACFDFHNVSEDVSVRLKLKGVDNKVYHRQTEVFLQGEGRCVGLRIPNELPRSCNLLINGRGRAGFRFQETTAIVIEAKTLLTFIETDKPIYKPGQTVRCRLLTVDAYMMTQLDNAVEVWIENPSGTRVVQWKEIQMERGLGSFEMTLSDDPILGSWVIKALVNDKLQQKSFKVDEYVLPKFEVTSSLPSYITIDDELVTGRICAKYTYGKPVRGSVRMKFCVKSTHEYRSRPCVKLDKPIDGCVDYEVNATEMQLGVKKFGIYQLVVNLLATVTEEATGIALNGSASREVTSDRLTLDLGSQALDYFKPGFPYNGKCVVKLPDGRPAADKQITIEATISHGRSQKQFARNYTSDEMGIISFNIPSSIVNEDEEIRLRAYQTGYEEVFDRYFYHVNVVRAYHTLTPWYSPSDSFLQVEPLTGTVSCSGMLDVKLRHISPGASPQELTFYYKVVSRGDIVGVGHQTVTAAPSTPNPANASDVDRQGALYSLTVPVTVKMSPTARLLVYEVRADGEVVADSVQFDVERCLENTVELRFKKAQRSPGSKATLQLTASPGSLCSIVAVDKSVTLLGGGGDGAISLSLESIFRKLGEYNKVQSPPKNDYCEKQMLKEAMGPRIVRERMDERRRLPPLPPPPPGRRPRGRGRRGRRGRRSMFHRFSSQYYDSSQAFKRIGAVVLSDLTVDSRPCEVAPLIVMAMAVAMAAPVAMPARMESKVGWVDEADDAVVVNSVSESEDEAVVIRSFFPETWLWDLETVDESGSLRLRRDVPDTITEWVARAVCTSEQTGVGVSASASLRAFQPFFVSFTLPYSVVRGEKVVVTATVFNYLDRCSVIRLTLRANAGFSLDGPRRVELCVCSNEARSHRYTITPLQLGPVNITVKANSISRQGICNNGLAMHPKVGSQDAVTRPLLVEPEGKEVEYTHSAFLCPQDTSEKLKESVELPLPPGVVEGSARAKVTIIGDVMGPTLSGLDGLLRLPTGCGEQNMVLFAPNIYVMQYLTNTDQLRGDVRDKALGFLKTGYQRELNYKHADGSYSAFGKSDASGSMWLTAFVVKSFSQAEPFIYVDPDQLAASIGWFRDQQLENGCFPQVGRILHKGMKGGLADGQESPATLTAYVLAAMLEAGITAEDDTVRQAVGCLQAQTVTDTYTLSVMAYAYTLLNSDGPLRREILDTLEERAINDEGQTHWSRSAPPPPSPPQEDDDWVEIPFCPAASADVEMTGYVLLARVIGQGASGVASALPIVKWLTKQRNAYGGFASTQDTVVALQALAQFAELVHGDSLDLDVVVKTDDQRERFYINGTNALLQQTQQITVPNRVLFKVTGAGCALVQANVKYNIHEITTPQDSFSLRVKTADTDKCELLKRRIRICTRYLGPDGESNMAVVSVKMVSGWIPDKMSLKLLMKNVKWTGVKRYEVEKNVANLYFDTLTSEEQCISIVVEQYVEVQDSKAAYVKVFDYYDQELSAMTAYSLPSVDPSSSKGDCHLLQPDMLELPDYLLPGGGDDEPVPVVEDVIIARYVEPLQLPEEEMVAEDAIGEGDDEPVPVVEDVIVPRQAEPLQISEEEEPAAVPSVARCPRCPTEVPENLEEKFCRSRHAFKVKVIGSDRRLLKVTTDLREATSRRNWASPVIVTAAMGDGCTCATLDDSAVSRLVVMTREDVASSSLDQILMKAAVIFKHTKRMERLLRQTLQIGCP